MKLWPGAYFWPRRCSSEHSFRTSFLFIHSLQVIDAQGGRKPQGNKGNKVLCCLHIVKLNSISGFTWTLCTKLVQTVNVSIERGQTNTISFFLLFNGLYLILLFPVLQTGREDSKIFMLEKKGCFFPWLQIWLQTEVKQMSSLKKFQCKPDPNIRQFKFFTTHFVILYFRELFLESSTLNHF